MAREKKLAFTYNAPVTLTFAIIAFVVLVIGWITKGKSTELFFEVYRSKISVLEHTLYFNGRIDSEVEALDRARMDSVSEAIPGFNYIKIM